MRYYLQKLQDILLKKDFDFDRPDINIYNFHPQLRLCIAVMGLFFNNRGSRIRFIWPCICILLAIVFMAFEGSFIWHGLVQKDYSFATECFCYWLILGFMPTLYISTLVNSKIIYEVVENMNEDFIFICGLGPKFRKSFLEGQLLIWQLTHVWFVFICFVGGLYVLLPVVGLVYQSLIATQDENTIRPLQFPIWLPNIDPHETPYYEMFLFIEELMVLCIVPTYCVYAYSLFHILLHYYTIMNMIMLEFDVIFEGLEESVACLPRYHKRRVEAQLILNEKIGKIVKWHLSVFRAIDIVSSVYGPSIVYQVICSNIAICLIAYQVAEKLEHGSLDILFCLLGMAIIITLWIPCYLGTMIRNKAFAVGDSCWNCGWHETRLGLMIRQDIIIIILRAQQPVTIKFTGLPHIQLETFSSLMRSSYSYFNMLRQYSK